MYDLIYNINTYNRVEMATRTVAQFIEHQAENTLIDVIDDHSTDDISAMASMIEAANTGSRAARLTINERNIGAAINQIGRLNDDIYDEQEFVYLSDDDVLLSRHFAKELAKLLQLMRTDASIFASTLFNVATPWHHELEEYDDGHVCKTSFGGVSFLMRARDFRDAIDRFLTPEYDGVTGWDWALVREGERRGQKLVASKMSYVQHIGVVGVHSSEKYFDHADNFVE